MSGMRCRSVHEVYDVSMLYMRCMSGVDVSMVDEVCAVYDEFMVYEVYVRCMRCIHSERVVYEMGVKRWMKKVTMKRMKRWLLSLR